MAGVLFSAIRGIPDLAQSLSSTPAALAEFLEADDQSSFYEEMCIPKARRGGGHRVVYKARQDLGLVQKVLADGIQSIVTFPECVQGFVRKRSIVSNAKLHLENAKQNPANAKPHLAPRVILHMDIRDFFGSITARQVEGVFLSLGCSADVAAALAKLCTLRGALPQGSSVSPVLANLVCKHLDSDLLTLAGAHHCAYSRYADDLTFSGDDVPPVSRVEERLRAHGFEPRPEKTRTQRRGRTQYVTGLCVCDEAGPRVQRRMKRRIRTILYFATKHGFDDHCARVGGSRMSNIAKIDGWIAFIQAVEPPLGAEMRGRWLPIRAAAMGQDVEPDDDESSGDDPSDDDHSESL